MTKTGDALETLGRIEKRIDDLKGFKQKNFSSMERNICGRDWYIHICSQLTEAEVMLTGAKTRLSIVFNEIMAFAKTR